LPSDTLDDKTPVEKTALKIARTYLHPNKATVVRGSATLQVLKPSNGHILRKLCIFPTQQ